MTAWPDDEVLSFRDLLEAEHEGKEDREASEWLTAWLDTLNAPRRELQFMRDMAARQLREQLEDYYAPMEGW